MNRTVRKSEFRDAINFIEIKDSLSLIISDNNNQGGFLLGTNLETYQEYISQGFCLSAMNSGSLVGFGIIFPNWLVKQSELWEKRKLVDWSIDLDELENCNIAFIEQLAFLKGHKKLVLILSYNLALSAFQNGAEYILTTTVRKPVLNKAALPLIKAVGGRIVGNINEWYPRVGQINSDIHLIAKRTFILNTKKRSSYKLLSLNKI